jgi:hypothetical protein
MGSGPSTASLSWREASGILDTVGNAYKNTARRWFTARTNPVADAQTSTVRDRDREDKAEWDFRKLRSAKLGSS